MGRIGRRLGFPFELFLKTPEEKSWLIFSDSSGLGDRLAANLRAVGARCRVARRGDRFASDGTDAFTLRAEAPEDWKQFFASAQTMLHRNVLSTSGVWTRPFRTLRKRFADGHRRLASSDSGG